MSSSAASNPGGTGAPRRGLGRGLEVLLGNGPGPAGLVDIPIGAIRPNARQPRRRLDSDGIAGLVESVRVGGVIQPILVRPLEDGAYELIAGERRWRAARAAGLATVPAVVRETDDRDSLLLALVENVAREDLSPVEEARAYVVLQDEFGLTLGDIAERVGHSKPTVSNRMRLLELPDDVIGLLERGLLSEGHARAVLSVPDHEERRRLARRIVRQGLSVRAAERAARWAGARTRPRRSAVIDPELTSRAQTAMERLTGAAVRVRNGRIEVSFAGETELEEILEALETALRLSTTMAVRAGD
jgi:ParB family transcriptional regulator, chromosome partitioning protein